MNIIYFAVGMAVSFFIAGFCESSEVPKKKVFLKAFTFEFVFVFGAGLLFWEYRLGFFEEESKDMMELMWVAAVAAFLSFLIGLKASHPEIN